MTAKKKKKKCGFVDCKNPVLKGRDYCQNCENRKENKTCHACSQPEPQSDKTLHLQHNRLLDWKNGYQLVEKIRSLVPSEVQKQLAQILPKLKLSSSEEKLIEKAQKVIEDVKKTEEFLENNPEVESLKNRLEEAREEVEKIRDGLDESKQNELKEAMEEFEAEIYGVAEENDNGGDKPNKSPNQDPPNQPNSKKCATCEKDLTNQSTSYSSQGKNYCSPICRDKGEGVDISSDKKNKN
ncbi:hypothetical protein C1645_842050 [Glomus cerebriforme]|uniref:Uncharacterized protein n=1 Tax=Glomus cerebriforme TaxID=658196 RepID=A0A397S294_9GLOM|nr:hypothetical protein C1645_842050 [Glomus cerebriforme]